MHVRQICKVSGEGASLRITIPRAVAARSGLHIGDHVAATIVGKCIVLVRVDDAVEQRVLATTNELINGLLLEPA